MTAEQLEAENLSTDGFAEQALLDPKSRHDLEQHLTELVSEIDEARHQQDQARVELLQREFDYITGQLLSATGKQGRSRTFSTAKEKVRLNVTRAIHTAIKTIKHSEPELGGYLEKSIATGEFCRYAPLPASAIRWQF